MPNSLFQLPQYQGDYYQLQRQQALANALMGNALQSRAPTQTVGSGGSQNYQVMPAMSPLAGVAQLGQALLSGQVANQASAGLNKLGGNIWDSMKSMMGGQPAAFMGGAQPSPQPGGTSSAVAGGAGQNADVGLGGLNGNLPANAGGAVSNVAPNGAAGSAGVAPNVTAMNPGGMNPKLAALMYMQDPSGYAKNFIAPYYQPAAIVQQIRAAGIDPNSGLGRQLAQQALAKQNYIAPVNARPGSILRDPLTMQPMAYNPHVPEGGTPVFDKFGNVVGIQQLPGAAQVTGAMSTAKASGPAQFSLQRVWNPQTNQYEYQSVANIADTVNGAPKPTPQPAQVGQPSQALQPSPLGQPAQPAPIRNNNPGSIMLNGRLAQYPDMQTGLAQLDSNLQAYGKQGVNTLAGVISKWAPPNENNTQAYINDVSQRLGIAPNTPIDLTNPLVRQALSTGIMLHENGPQAVFGSGQAPSAGAAPGTSGVAAAPGASGVAAAPPPGYVQGQQDLQSDLTKKWNQLNAANSQAQTTTSYLQNIQGLAQKAAVGPMSDRIDFVNGLLSLAGSAKATDAVTANDLLDKYSSQIVARLGQGGMGTDAARTILQAAYPGAHMNAPAIDEAVANLVAANKMTQAKASLLQPAYNSRNPQAYNQKEMIFDQNADPRIWQYQGITDPAARQAFARQVMQQDPHFADKIRALEKIGAIQ